MLEWDPHPDIPGAVTSKGGMYRIAPIRRMDTNRITAWVVLWWHDTPVFDWELLARAETLETAYDCANGHHLARDK